MPSPVWPLQAAGAPHPIVLHDSSHLDGSVLVRRRRRAPSSGLASARRTQHPYPTGVYRLSRRPGRAMQSHETRVRFGVHVGRSVAFKVRGSANMIVVAVAVASKNTPAPISSASLPTSTQSLREASLWPVLDDGQGAVVSSDGYSNALAEFR
ncbi:unnamed protein product [Diplocarpon coronariae]|uniref:Uncharacterized protein n=1 Tax=Diplocarpon coronariae TaxID=2795749 RepID=A0A218ZA69_9HELO|nr:hypothetical protein JHW43_006083 [Diplocarpon mali]OWP04175.1 hypothetical protein B2J93_384 [Marssonina coronariae]